MRQANILEGGKKKSVYSAFLLVRTFHPRMLKKTVKKFLEELCISHNARKSSCYCGQCVQTSATRTLPQRKKFAFVRFLFLTQELVDVLFASHWKSMLRGRGAILGCFTCTSSRIIEEKVLQFDSFTSCIPLIDTFYKIMFQFSWFTRSLTHKK